MNRLLIFKGLAARSLGSRKMRVAAIIVFFAFISLSHQSAAQLGPAVRQVIVTQAPAWNSQQAIMQCFERRDAQSPWLPVFKSSIPVLLGRNGMAWGRGVFTPPNNGIAAKVEKDGKAPAGVFRLGRMFGYAPRPPDGIRWPYVQVGRYDAWVDDPQNPYYNQHVRVTPDNIPPWFEKQRMRLGDSAYKWMLVIDHNANPPVSGYGSAIFFHVRRGPKTPTAGCTSMAEENLVKVLRWLRVEASPHYVLLPEADYQALRRAWGLP
jgi:L,D-peptidoglycan transpeptidase YkuD (ErfK/YbiS/YcfS/YnhG family)